MVLYVKPSNKGFIIPLLSHFQVFWHLVYEIHSLTFPDNNRKHAQRTKTTIMRPSKCSLGWLKKSSPKYRKEIKVLIMIIQCGHFVSPPSVCISAQLYSVLRPLIVANIQERRKITYDGVTWIDHVKDCFKWTAAKIQSLRNFKINIFVKRYCRTN